MAPSARSSLTTRCGSCWRVDIALWRRRAFLKGKDRAAAPLQVGVESDGATGIGFVVSATSAIADSQRFSIELVDARPCYLGARVCLAIEIEQPRLAVAIL